MCMQPNENQDKPSLVILFRSKLTSQAGEDYQAMNAEMETLVRQNPGFVDVKSYTAADGAPHRGVVAGRGVADGVEKSDAPSRGAKHRSAKMV
jgi:hypothetical protein